MMKPTIIFCGAVWLAVLAVILLSLLSPVSHRKQSKQPDGKSPWAVLSLYLQQPVSTENVKPYMQPVVESNAGVFVFRRTLTEGPENTSRIVGKAQGFIIPDEQFAHSSFNIIHLSYETPEYSGSLSVHAKYIGRENREELAVVGGTGSFAFARGIAIFLQTGRRSSYHLKLQLQFPK